MLFLRKYHYTIYAFLCVYMKKYTSLYVACDCSYMHVGMVV